MSKLDALKSNVTRTFYRAGFNIKKHSPELLIGVGIVGVVTSTVLACRATLKVDEVTSDTKNKVDRIHMATEKGRTEAGEEYTQEDSKKDLAIVYTQTGLSLAKLYAPAVILGVASVGCIVASNHILRTRNIALVAAYKAVDSGFKDYRKRVVERFGKELDRELKYDIKAKEIEETVVDENGETKTVKKTVETVDPNYLCSEYAKFYDDGCKGWQKDAEYNLMFLRQTQDYFNEKLRREGHVFLNDVYKELGIKTTRAGQIVGWVYDPTDANRDCHIDFGIYDLHNEKARDFVNGYERTILLDFNVDGPIVDLLP